ncbi:16S rRNA processing protein RimM [Austwickia chelonae]|uniref:Ribosome maturation factor RimM n=1 Tax=Austwickia chelonae NBRC 105200 TaxID=1184607 RepID=K6UKP0_9MICO|nr:ribosome maturation factor RimM [Austwickia chelonae]GAB76566.1 ribosome maturation factor RimM [Austwickia chelonae NBRC 105200]SEW26987.1 16S rRNA processing protein RimM [Austwickia chelonae]
MDTVVARIGKAHGLRGEVTVQIHTDDPENRFSPGAVFVVEGLPDTEELVLSTARVHNGIWLLGFEGHPDRTAAEALRGGRLVLPAEESDGEGWYESELIGLSVFSLSGERLGQVTGLSIGAAQDRLSVRLDDGRTGSVPFVEALVPIVDLANERVVIDAPDGLFDLDGAR